jgi:uncharacterized protein (TIRG00374 family)
MKKKLGTIFQFVFFIGLGIFLVWWSIKDLNTEDKSHIKTALQNARVVLIIPVFCILLLSHFVRAMRWKLLIESLGYHPAKANTFFAVAIGYLANQAVPRLGEVVKCTILAKYEKIPADKLIGTIILERLIDAITLLVIFAITLVIQPTIYKDLIDIFFNPAEASAKEEMPMYIVILIALGIITLAVAIWMFIKKKNLKDLIALCKRIWNSVWQGVGSIRHLRSRWQFLFYTISLWSLYFAGGYIGFFALRETEMYGIKEAFAILSAGSVGMIATPGGIGAYALLVEKTMQIYGLQKGVALAFGWLLWLAQTSVILVGGLISFGLLPWYNRKNKKDAADVSV